MAKPFIIGITGGSGSGKTSFIRALRNSFTPHELCIVSQDDYYKPREQQLTDSMGYKNFDLPTSIDEVSFVDDVTKLISGVQINRTEYTFNNEKANPQVITCYPAPVMVVEGIFVFHFKNIWNLLDLKVYLHAKENLKIIRRIRRDQVERNYPVEDVLYRYEHHVMPTYEHYILPYIENTDIIINNNKNFKAGLNLMESFIRQKLTILSKITQ